MGLVESVMSANVATLAAVLALGASSAFAADFDGVYKPALPFAAGWNCAMAQASGNGLVIEGETLSAMGVSCSLKKPVPVRQMDATLFDASCKTGDETETHRVMLMKTATGVLELRRGSAVEWLACQ